jgi:hypothetical protein
MVHHTASNPSSDGQSDVNYICHGSPNKPIANLYLDRQGVVWVCAAGATNTNGQGTDFWGGNVPKDRMNEHAIGIEAANNGVGEPWPKAQTDAYVTLVAALCKQYNIPVGRVRAHAEWARGRKIDPAGPSPWATSGTWDMDAFRAAVAMAGAPAPKPPESKEIDMIAIDWKPGTPEWTAFTVTGAHMAWTLNGHADQVYRNVGVPRQTVSDAALEGLIGSSQTVTDPPPTLTASMRSVWDENRIK